MTNDFYGFYKDENGYVVTKNGDDFLHTSTQISAADIVDRLMADAVSVEKWRRWKMETLKPCPFCGKERAFVDYIFHEERPYYQHYARVMCAVCQAEVGDTGFSDTREEAEEKAIKAWNRRAYETD